MIYFKYIKSEMYVILSNIFNRGLVEGVFPSAFKKLYHYINLVQKMICLI